MKEYIKTFETESAMTEYLEGADIDVFVGYTKDTEKVHWSDAIPAPSYDKKYLTFDIISAGTINNDPNYTIYYSFDNGVTWSATDGTPFNVSAGDKVLWKGLYNDGYYGTSIFSGSTATFNIEGNIMSLIYGDNFIGQTTLLSDYPFAALFKELNVVSARNLILPATTLTYTCYNQMFYGCTSLTEAPELPAPTLTEWCYGAMFRGCTRLNYIKCLATDKSASNCTTNWVNGVASSGTFVKAASMNDWTTGVDGIPANWTIENE